MPKHITEWQMRELHEAAKWSPALNELLDKLHDMWRCPSADRDEFYHMADDAAKLCHKFSDDCGSHGYVTPEDAA